ncbi:MAG: hypothetical protein WKF59_18820 [Chitinophagaceae bacterium]
MKCYKLRRSNLIGMFDIRLLRRRREKLEFVNLLLRLAKTQKSAAA